MKFLKKNPKVTFGIIAGIFLLLAIFFVVIFIMPLFGHNKYGNRLDGADKVKISNSTQSEMIAVVEETGKFDSVKYDLKGRIINIIAVAKNGVSKDEAKEASAQVLSKLSDDEKEYYDVQIFLTQDGMDGSTYPYIGYKNKSSEKIVWTNN